MSRYQLVMLFITATVVVIVGIVGCTQSEDIVAGASLSNMYLTAERLPSTPPGMVYELWLANSTDTVSVGRFGWNNDTKKFLTVAGANRPDSNLFSVADDLFSFDHAFVSVEVAGSPQSVSPGPIMLIDDVTDASVNPIELIFPQRDDSLGSSIARYNMQSTSDDSRGQRGHAIWFSSYRQAILNVIDTLDLRIIVRRPVRARLLERDLYDTTIDSSVMPWDTIVDTIEDGDSTFINSTGSDTLDKSEVFISVPWDTSNVVRDSVALSFGRDTFTLGTDPGYHYFMTFEIDSAIDSTNPYQIAEFQYLYTSDTVMVPLDIFTQDDFGLPDYSAMGWRYKGWVVSPALADSIATRLTPPAWYNVDANKRYIPGADGAVITTGTFARIEEADDDNPFVISGIVPEYPGEDFLNSTTLQTAYGISSANLVPQPSGNVGTVFITLEPDNFPQDTTNFPLVVMTEALPATQAELNLSLQQYTMRNWTQVSEAGGLIGFPKITINFERF